MANKTIQLLRNSSLFATHEAAITGLTAQLANAADGQPILARYTGADNKEHTLLGIKGNGAGAYEIFDNEGTQSAAVTNVKYDSTTKKITYTKNGQDTDVVTLAAVATSGAAVDVAIADAGGIITATTVEGALQEIAAEIDGMDLTEVGGTDGDVITAISEADGKVSASKSSLSEVVLTGYSKTSDTGAIAATDTVEEALSKLENKAANISVGSLDKTVTVQTATGAAFGTDLSVNIDGNTLVKNASSGVIRTDLKIQSITQGEGSTYASQYQLVYGSSNTPIGDVISVAKDQFLKEARFDAATQTLILTMYTATGATTDIEVDFSSVVIEAEAGAGLYADQTDHSINIGIDANSEAVTISDGQGGSTTAAVLTVGADSIKVDNIQAAINYAVSTATGNLDYTDTAESHKFVTEVDEVNGVISVQRAQPTAGDIATTAVAADSTHVAIAGTDAATQIDNISVAIKAEETARESAIAALDAEVTSTDGTNVQVKVTEADGVITAVDITTDNTVNATDVSNAIGNLNYTDTAITNQFVTAVSETGGVISVTRAQPAAAGVSIADTGDYFTATNVEDALAELAVFNCGTY